MTKQQYRLALAKQLYRQHPSWQQFSWGRLSEEAKQHCLEEADAYAKAERGQP